MPTLNNTNEGGSQGVTVTTANSGGTSGNAWNAVSIGTSAAVTYDNTHAYGTRATKFVSGTSATFVAWTTSLGLVTEVWGRVYAYFTANPSQPMAICRIRNGTQQIARISITTAGKVELRDSGNAVLLTSTTAIATAAWIRLEFYCAADPFTGALEARLYNSPDSVTVTETLVQNPVALNFQADTVNWGPVGAAGGVTFWLDNYNVNTDGFPGPQTQVASPSSIASAEAHGTTALLSTVALSPGGVASAEAHGTTAVSSSTPIGPSGIASGEAHGASVLSQAPPVSPSGIASGEAHGTAALAAGEAVVSPMGLVSGETFGLLTLIPDQFIDVTGIPSAEDVSPPGLQQAVLRPPVVREAPVAPGPLFERYRLYRGVSIIRWQDGTYSTVRYPAQTDIEIASRVYMGGHVHPLTAAEISDLTAAGYGEYISYE